MVVFDVKFIFKRIIGFRAPGKVLRCGYILARIFASTSMFLIFLSLSINFVLHVNDDFSQAWPSLPLIFGYFSTILVYWHFLLNGSHFHALLVDLQDIVQESEIPDSWTFWLTYLIVRAFWLICLIVWVFQERPSQRMHYCTRRPSAKLTRSSSDVWSFGCPCRWCTSLRS